MEKEERKQGQKREGELGGPNLALKKKRVKVVITLLGIVLIVGLFVPIIASFLEFTGDKPQANTETKKGSGKKEVIEKKKEEEFQGIIKEGMDSMDISVCNKIKDNKEREDCKNQVQTVIAAREYNTSLCDKVTDELLKGICKDNVLLSRAMRDQDVSLCEQIKNENLLEQCIKMIAVK